MFNSSEQLAPLDPFEDEPWIADLLELYRERAQDGTGEAGSPDRFDEPASKRGLGIDPAPMLRVAVAHTFPEDPGGFRESSPLRRRLRVPHEELAQGFTDVFGAAAADQCRIGGKLGHCMPTDVPASLIAAMRADLLNWPLQPQNRSGELLQLLWGYDIVIFQVIERRFLPAMPLIPGQLRLWIGREAYAYGDTSDKRYREFNVFTPSRLKQQGFCQVPFDPFFGGSYHYGPTSPFWTRFPMREVSHTLPLEAAARGAGSSRILMRVAKLKLAEAVGRALRRLGWELDDTWRAPSMSALLDLLASCRFVIYLPYRAGQGRSAGRLIMQAALLGIPIFSPRSLLFARLLMPPFLSWATAAELARKIRFLRANPAAEQRIRASIARRRALADLRGAPGPRDVADVVRYASGEDPLCTLDPEARRAALGRRSGSGGAPELRLRAALSAEAYFRRWLRESLAAFKSNPLARLEQAAFVDAVIIECKDFNNVRIAEQTVAHVRYANRHDKFIDRRLVLLGQCVLVAARPAILDPPLMMKYVDLGLRALAELSQKTSEPFPLGLADVERALTAMSAPVERRSAVCTAGLFWPLSALLGL